MADQDSETLLPMVEPLQGQKATLLLGTDRHIGEETPGGEETRVGVIPAQVSILRSWLQKAGIYLDFRFMQGAGARAGYLDGDYLNVGGQMVFEHELSTLTPPDVFHALKEPSPYESFVRGPFMRIGALHTGAFDPTSGLASLFKRKNFCAIFDGSNIGGFAYRISKGQPIPIRSSMSVFAGWIAADYGGRNGKLASGKVVISGGGVCGAAALERLLAKYKGAVTNVVVVEQSTDQCRALRGRFGDDERVAIVERSVVTAEDLADATRLILTAYRPGHPAPKVVGVGDLTALADGALIVDVSIDERGGVNIPGLDFGKMPLLHVIESVRTGIANLGRGFEYVGDSHLPRSHAREASESHGKAVLPYLAALLYLAAREGGASQAIDFILSHECANSTQEYFEALLCDLKNGLAFWRPDPIHAYERITTGIRASMDSFLKREGIAFECE